MNFDRIKDSGARCKIRGLTMLQDSAVGLSACARVVPDMEGAPGLIVLGQISMAGATGLSTLYAATELACVGRRHWLVVCKNTIYCIGVVCRPLSLEMQCLLGLLGCNACRLFVLGAL